MLIIAVLSNDNNNKCKYMFRFCLNIWLLFYNVIYIYISLYNIIYICMQRYKMVEITDSMIGDTVIAIAYIPRIAP